MEKTRIIIKKNSRLSPTELKKILNIKNTFWKYGLSSQRKWFKKNVRSKDYNFLFFLGKKMIGYTLLRERKYRVKTKENNFFLLDTIIIDKKYRSLKYGSKLINVINNFIIEKKIISILYCQKKIVNFYKKNSWCIMTKKIIPSFFHRKNRSFLIFNKRMIGSLGKNKIFFRLD